MRLTKYLKEAFVRAAMDDVPKIDYQEKIISMIIAEAVRQLPPKVRAIYNDKSLRGFLEERSNYWAAFTFDILPQTT